MNLIAPVEVELVDAVIVADAAMRSMLISGLMCDAALATPPLPATSVTVPFLSDNCTLDVLEQLAIANE